MLKCNGCGLEQRIEAGMPGAPHFGCDGKGIWLVTADRIYSNNAKANAWHGSAMVTLDDWKEKNTENQRLRMELADVRQTLSAQQHVTLSMGDEISFCKAEIRRLDPRLWAARWGR